MKIGKKIILTSIIFSILVFILLYFGVYFLIKNIQRNSEDFITAKKEISIVRAEAKNLEYFKKTYGSLELELTKIPNLFIDAEVPIDFIKFLETAASSSGVSAEISLASSKIVAKDPWPFFQFQLNLAGSTSNFFKFLEKIEAAPYLIEIQNLSAVKLSEEEEVSAAPALGEISAVLSIKVFTK